MKGLLTGLKLRGLQSDSVLRDASDAAQSHRARDPRPPQVHCEKRQSVNQCF
jgi:hypothetical protein